MEGVQPPPVQRSLDHSNPPGAKRARDGNSQGQGDRRGGKKRQAQPPVSLTQLSGGLAPSGTAQSSLLLCLHALTHCTDQLKQSAAEPSQEDFQLLSDIASAAGRLQRLARQRLQLLQAPPADAEQQQAPSRQELNQHDACQQRRHNSQQVHSQQAMVQTQAQEQQEVLLQHPQTRPPASQSCSKQQQQHAPEQRHIRVKEEPSEATVKGRADKPPQQQQQANKPQQAPAPRQAEVQPYPVHQGTPAAAWQVDRQPYVIGSTQGATATATSDKAASHDNASRAAAALAAALTAAAAEACDGQGEATDNSTAQQKAGAPPPAVQLPALKPVSQLPRDRLKSLAAGFRSQSTAAGAVALAEAAAAGAKPPVALVGRQQGSLSGVPAESNKPIHGSAILAGARNAQPLSSASGGSGTATSSSATNSSDSSSSSGSSDDKSSNRQDSDSSSDADSSADLPLTQLQDKHTPKKQKQTIAATATATMLADKGRQKREADVAMADVSQAALSTTAAGDEGPQQCLVCRRVVPADKLISSKLFCSCKGCLAAAVSRGSSRGYRVAQCPKRGCNAMVIKLGKAGWHTGDSGQAHYVDIDGKTGLFRIGYSRKRSNKKRSSRKGARKGAAGSRKRSSKS